MAATSPSPARGPRRAVGNAMGAIAGVGFGLAIGSVLTSQDWEVLSMPGETLTAFSRLLAVAGTYAVMICVLQIARIPWLEREVGLDRLVSWHRKLAPWGLWAIGGHVLLVLMGYAARDQASTWSEFWDMFTGTRWIMPATVGFVLMVTAGVTSYRIARRKMRYETWWVVHLYTYLAIALAFAHQLTLGQPFMKEGWARTFWIGLYVVTLGAVVAFRFGMPAYRAIRHQMKVHAVVQEGPGVVSVWISGRKLDRMGAQGGQFFAWRFMTRENWWQAHPYSLSAPPQSRFLRITVKDLGDHSAWLAQVKPGTRVVAEGPYGAFTADRRSGNRIVLIGAGVGITPIRAMLEELPHDARVDVLYRASTVEDLILREEFEALAARPGVRVRYLVGKRTQHPMDARTLIRLVPDIKRADVFVCGPDAMTTAITSSLETIGVEDQRIHAETFSY